MNIKTILPISEARKKIFEIAEKVQRPAVNYVLTEKGRPKAVIMSADEFESWKETIEVLHEFPCLEKDVKKIDSAVRAGKYKNWATLDDVMAEYGYVVADKIKINHGMGSKNRKRSAKRTE